jgi:hypothetical protein
MAEFSWGLNIVGGSTKCTCAKYVININVCHTVSGHDTDASPVLLAVHAAPARVDAVGSLMGLSRRTSS